MRVEFYQIIFHRLYDVMTFLLNPVDMADYSDLFKNTKPALHKPYFIVGSNLFYILLD